MLANEKGEKPDAIVAQTLTVLHRGGSAIQEKLEAVEELKGNIISKMY